MRLLHWHNAHKPRDEISINQMAAIPTWTPPTWLPTPSYGSSSSSSSSFSSHWVRGGMECKFCRFSGIDLYRSESASEAASSSSSLFTSLTVLLFIGNTHSARARERERGAEMMLGTETSLMMLSLLGKSQKKKAAAYSYSSLLQIKLKQKLWISINWTTPFPPAKMSIVGEVGLLRLNVGIFILWVNCHCVRQSKRERMKERKAKCQIKGVLYVCVRVCFICLSKRATCCDLWAAANWKENTVVQCTLRNKKRGNNGARWERWKRSQYNHMMFKWATDWQNAKRAEKMTKLINGNCWQGTWIPCKKERQKRAV